MVNLRQQLEFVLQVLPWWREGFSNLVPLMRNRKGLIMDDKASVASLAVKAEACRKELQEFQRVSMLTVWDEAHFGDPAAGFAVVAFEVGFIMTGFNALLILTIEDKTGKQWKMPVVSNSWRGEVLPYASISILPLLFGEDGKIYGLMRAQYRFGVGKRVWTFAQGYASDSVGNLVAKFLKELQDEFGEAEMVKIIGRFSENPDYVDREFLFAVAILSKVAPQGVDLEQSAEVRLVDLSSPEALAALRREQTETGAFSNTALHALWYIESLLTQAGFEQRQLRSLFQSQPIPPCVEE